MPIDFSIEEMDSKQRLVRLTMAFRSAISRAGVALMAILVVPFLSSPVWSQGTDLTKQVLSKPELYAPVLVDMVQKLGFATLVALGVIVFLCRLVIKLVNDAVSGYKESARYAHEENKRYQEFFLKERQSSGKKYLDEDKDGRKD